MCGEGEFGIHFILTPVMVKTVDSVLNSEISAFNLNNETIEVGLKRLALRSAPFAMEFEQTRHAAVSGQPFPTNSCFWAEPIGQPR